VREAHFCDLEVELVFRKISETDATRCQILRLKCTKFDFRWGCATDLVGGVYSAPPDLLAVRPTSKGRDGREREEGGEEKGRRWGGERQRRGRDLPENCFLRTYVLFNLLS